MKKLCKKIKRFFFLLYLNECHVDFVHVRALLTVNFYINEVFIHNCSYPLILKGLPLHHMAPMAGRVPDGQKYQFLLIPCSKEQG